MNSKDINRINSFAIFNAMVSTAAYFAAGRFPVVAFTLREESYSRIYIGDSRHLYGAVQAGYHPHLTDRVQFDKPIQVAKPEWMDRKVTSGQVAGYVRKGRIPVIKPIRTF